MQYISGSEASAHLTPQQSPRSSAVTQELGTHREQLLPETLQGTTRGFLNANDSVIQDPMIAECGYQSFYTLWPKKTLRGGAGVGGAGKRVASQTT